MLSGEAVPVVKQPGDRVVSGTIALSGAIVVRADRIGKDTTLARIVRLVEEAQTRQAPVQKLADTVAGYFVYGVMAVAIAVFLFWYFAGVHLWPEVLQASTPDGMSGTMQAISPAIFSLKLCIAVLVVACPCSLGLATPTAVLVGTSLGAERGLLIKGGDILERARQLDTIAFDKTGTLTEGTPEVTDAIACEGDSEATLVRLAAAVERGSTHPLADAIVRRARHLQLSIPEARDFRTEPGMGATATIGDRAIYVGTAAWLAAQNATVGPDLQSEAERLAKAGKTVTFVAAADPANENMGGGERAGKTILGLLAAADRLKPEAATAVRQLRALGLRVVMLTGDRRAAAIAVGRSLDLEPADIFAEIKPAEKAAAIARLQAEGRWVGMVGDGINDAPALATAHVGVGLRGTTDVAIEAAQIVLMSGRNGNLNDVARAIGLSRATFAKIRQNLFWAFAYNIVGIPLAAGALLPASGILLGPSAAAALMAFSSVSVVANSLLLRLSRDETRDR